MKNVKIVLMAALMAVMSVVFFSCKKVVTTDVVYSCGVTSMSSSSTESDYLLSELSAFPAYFTKAINAKFAGVSDVVVSEDGTMVNFKARQESEIKECSDQMKSACMSAESAVAEQIWHNSMTYTVTCANTKETVYSYSVEPAE